MLKKIFAYALVTLLVSNSLSGCGWRLRGSTSHLLDTSVALSGTGAVYQKLKTRLDKKQLLQSVDLAELRLNILDEKWDRRTATVNNNSRTAQYRLKLTVNYQISNKEGQVIDANKKVAATRTFSFDENDIAGKSKEENLIKKDIQQQVLRQVLQRLKFVSNNTAPINPDHPNPKNTSTENQSTTVITQ